MDQLKSGHLQKKKKRAQVGTNETSGNICLEDFEVLQRSTEQTFNNNLWMNVRVVQL